MAAVARYHVTPTGPKLCSASIRSCPYGGEENHFVDDREASRKFANTPKSAAQLFKEKQPAAKTLTLMSDEETTKIVHSKNWGSSISDLIDQHIETTSVKPEQIQFSLYWTEPSLNGDPTKDTNYLFEALPRLDDHLGKFTNIYRIAFWSPSDAATQNTVNSIIGQPGNKDLKWSKIPNHLKWEAAFGEIVPVADPKRNDYISVLAQATKLRKKHDNEFRLVLSDANHVDVEALSKKLYNPSQAEIAQINDSRNAGTIKNNQPTELALYEKSLARKANNIVGAIQAVENSIIGPYNAYDRGIGFYRLDSDRRTIVEENLSSTFVRGRHLHQLGLDSDRWLAGAWKGDDLGDQGRFERVYNSGDKGIPYQSPMTFWTANTPDGARWELGLDVSSPEAGSNRVRYFDAANPNVAVSSSTPTGPIEGFASMKESMEERYGESSKWSPGLQKDMKVLADIVEGHRVMTVSGKSSRDRLKSFGLDKEAKAATKAAAEKAEHKSLFGGLGKLFG